MTPAVLALALLHAACSLALVAFAAHALALAALARGAIPRARARQDAAIAAFRARAVLDTDWPVVTTQLPLYDEAEVATRAIDAAVALDYPAGRHQVQVLDDSRDVCAAIVEDHVRELARAGVWVELVRREGRDGYKAGALAHGLATAQGELVAVFDADFVPPPDFLRRAVPLVLASADLGCVQGRWEHLPAGDGGWLARAQRAGIDAHFAVEQAARSAAGLYLNFNGTAGVWRRSAIDQGGGWRADTLAEDLDLSYRAQLAGWRIDFAPDLACPAEVPGTIAALAAQQRRWARGSMRVAVRALVPVWRAPGSLLRKLAATFHLGQYLVSALMVALVVLAWPLVVWGPAPETFGAWSPVAALVVVASALAPCACACAAGHALGRLGSAARALPALVVLGAGLSLNNAVAALRGVFPGGGEFVRTPKDGGRGVHGRYRAPPSSLWWAELSLGAHAAAAAVYGVAIGRAWAAPFLAIHAVGLLAVGSATAPWARRGAAPEAQPTVAPSEVGSRDLAPDERIAEWAR